RNKEPSETLKLTNITLHYLPPHTTAHIQPMDAGIIKSFKSKYKRLYCEYVLKQFESNANIEKKKITIKKAIDFIAESWDNVSNTTIQNCWNKTRILPNTNEPDMDTVDQPESDILLENNEIEEIVAKLPDESLYAPETAQVITTYLQVIDEPVATEEILDDEGIISMVQADENEESVSQEIEDEDEVPDPPVTAAEVFNAMQTVIRYEEQENSESNLSLEELGFLRNLLKEYKRVYEKSKKQKKITSFFNFQGSHSYDSHPDLYFQDLYSQDPYPQDSYSQDSYSQGPYSQDSYSQNLYSQESDLQKSDSQESDSQELCLQDS
ncbi:6822_t:CDS:2, partial [Gigaspora rosea]